MHRYLPQILTERFLSFSMFQVIRIFLVVPFFELIKCRFHMIIIVVYKFFHWVKSVDMTNSRTWKASARHVYKKKYHSLFKFNFKLEHVSTYTHATYHQQEIETYCQQLWIHLDWVCQQSTSHIQGSSDQNVSLTENCTPSSHTGQEQVLSILEYLETSVRKITKYNDDDKNTV